jgi:hypothetical protein
MADKDVEAALKRGRLIDRLHLVVIIAVSAVVLALTVNAWATKRTNDAQDRADAALIRQNDALLECVDRFATDLSEGLPVIRDATKERDDANTRALVALQSVLLQAVDGSVGRDDFTEAAAAIQSYLDAAENLDNKRLANPYPPPPSVSCRGVSPTAH